MTLKEIQELVKIINKSNVAEIRIERKDFKITLKAQPDARIIPEGTQAIAAPIQQPIAQVPPAAETPASTPAAATSAPKTESKELAVESDGEATESENMIVINSPMIGTFYRSASPEKDPYVKVGDIIKPGDVICTIEAMKLFNEIESEVSGKVAKVLVENSSPVEYDQPLFHIEPA